LRLRCYRHGAHVKAEVSDSGPGIAPEYINHIYDPFFTTKPVGIGTGLGLYVTHGIISKHKGTIDVDTGPKKGTSFVLSFRSSIPASEARE